MRISESDVPFFVIAQPCWNTFKLKNKWLLAAISVSELITKALQRKGKLSTMLGKNKTNDIISCPHEISKATINKGGHAAEEVMNCRFPC